MSPPLGRKVWPTIVSRMELLPALWLPTQIICGKRPLKVEEEEEASCNLLRHEASTSSDSDMLK